MSVKNGFLLGIDPITGRVAEPEGSYGATLNKIVGIDLDINDTDPNIGCSDLKNAIKPEGVNGAQRKSSTAVAAGGFRAQENPNVCMDQEFKVFATNPEGGLNITLADTNEKKLVKVFKDSKRHGTNTACGSDFAPVTVHEPSMANP